MFLTDVELSIDNTLFRVVSLITHRIQEEREERHKNKRKVKEGNLRPSRFEPMPAEVEQQMNRRVCKHSPDYFDSQ